MSEKREKYEAALDLGAIRARLGHVNLSWKWEFEEGDWGGIVRSIEDDRTVATVEMEVLGYQFRWDGEFIGNAPTDIKNLLDEVEKFRTERDQLKNLVRWLANTTDFASELEYMAYQGNVEAAKVLEILRGN